MTFSTMLKTMSAGMLRTCGIFVLTLLFSLPLGVFVALGRMSKIRPLQWLIKVYIAVMRGTPLMLQLLVWYFGPYYLFGWSIRGYRYTAIILGFVFNYAAYFAEIYRSKAQTFLRIILPQVIKRILPSITNEVITLVKDTSLAFTLAYQEVFSLAKQIAASQTSFTPFVIAGVFFFIANYVVAFIMERFEKTIREMNQEREPTPERIHEIVSSERYFPLGS